MSRIEWTNPSAVKETVRGGIVDVMGLKIANLSQRPQGLSANAMFFISFVATKAVIVGITKCGGLDVLSDVFLRLAASTSPVSSEI